MNLSDSRGDFEALQGTNSAFLLGESALVVLSILLIQKRLRCPLVIYLPQGLILILLVMYSSYLEKISSSSLKIFFPCWSMLIMTWNARGLNNPLKIESVFFKTYRKSIVA